MKKPKRPQKLTIKQERFCQEIGKDWNAAQAAIRAGYSKKAAKEIGYENLTKPHILERVREELNRLQKETEVTKEMAIRETARIALSRMDSYLSFGPGGVLLKPIEDMTEDEVRAIGEVSETITKEGGSLRFKLHSKTTALDQLHRIFGSYQDKVDVTHHGVIPITEVEIARPKEDD